MILLWICGGESGLPIIFLRHLRTTPGLYFKNCILLLKEYTIHKEKQQQKNSCCHCLVAQLCLVLCQLIDYNPQGFCSRPVHGISHARMLEWVVISFSRKSSQPRDWTIISCIGRWILYFWATWEKNQYHIQIRRLPFPIKWLIIHHYRARKGWVKQKFGGRRETLVWAESVQFSRSVVSDSLRPHESQHARPPCPSPTPRVHSDSRPLSQWCHPAISSCVIPFSSCPQSLPASESFPMSQLFAWGGQSIGVSQRTPRTDLL